MTNPITEGRKLPIQSQAESAAAVTPSDTADFSQSGGVNLYIGGAGNIKVDMIDTGTVTFSGVLAGSFLPIKVSRVYSTGTTATNITALY